MNNSAPGAYIDYVETRDTREGEEMVSELVNVLKLPVEIRGGMFEVVRRFDQSFRSAYRNVGGYAIELTAYQSGVGRIDLRMNGRDSFAHRAYFDTLAEAQAEYTRLETLLWSREWVGWAADKLTRAGILPTEFLPAVLSGDGESLLAAADLRDEQDAPNAALLLRAAYHRLNGNVNVNVRAGKGKVIVMNPHQVTKRSPGTPGIGGLQAAVIDEGKSIRIVYMDDRERRELVGGQHQWVYRCEMAERTFKPGDPAEYDSYNLVYYAPIETITAKSVLIGKGHRGKKTRFTIARFVAKNFDFDLAVAEKRNNEWTD